MISSSNKRLKLTLEPIRLSDDLLPTEDGTSVSIFAPPIKLYDVNLQDSTEVFTREEKKPLGERLKRVWVERVEYAGKTPIEILNEDEQVDENGKSKEGEELDRRPTVLEMKSLQENLMKQLDLARSELTTALDLLSVIAPVTIPPSVDPLALPLPSETLTLVQTLPSSSSSSSNQPDTVEVVEGIDKNLLPLATSLASIRSSATSFFTASELLLPPSPSTSTSTSTIAKSDPWPNILSLHSSTSSSYTFIPLGAQKGATLSSKSTASSSASSGLGSAVNSDTKLARSIGIFFGAQESGERFRFNSVIRMYDLIRSVEERNKIGEGTKGKGKGKGRESDGRYMVIVVREGNREERNVWKDDEESTDGETSLDVEIERDLKRRARSIFAEELFASLSNEARLDSTLKAKLVLGKKSVGDSVIIEGHEWSLTITMVHNPTLSNSKSSTHKKSILSHTLLSLLRLLFLQEYSQRRLNTSHISYSSSNAINVPWTRPLLQTLSILLSHRLRLKTLIKLLSKLRSTIIKRSKNEEEPEGEEEVEIEVFGSSNILRDINSGIGELGDLAEITSRILSNEKEIGGRLVLRTSSKTFHISHSLLLPSNPILNTITSATVPHQALVLQSSKGPPVPVPSFAHLELFLREQLGEKEGERDNEEEEEEEEEEEKDIVDEEMPIR